MGWLIAYDISSPRRWRRVYRLVREHGWRLQYSLFWADIDGRGAERLAAALTPLIDLREDDVRLYFLPDGAFVRMDGPRPWPRGVDHAAVRRFDDGREDPLHRSREDPHWYGEAALK